MDPRHPWVTSAEGREASVVVYVSAFFFSGKKVHSFHGFSKGVCDPRKVRHRRFKGSALTGKASGYHR